MSIFNLILHQIGWLFRKIQVFALVGGPGTGKSFRAQLIAEKYKIELLIDDGILIRDSKIVAGKSAKKEKGALSAIKTALFDDMSHRKEVRHAISKQKFSKILIIGTSERMVKKIAHRLELPHISKFIKIEDIATTKDIQIAKRSRENEGKHIIPVPGIEVRRKYSQIFIDSVMIFIKDKFRFPLTSRKKVFEKSIVTPEYSKKGKLLISESALIQMVIHCVSEYNPLIKINKIIFKVQTQGYIVDLVLQVPFGLEIPEIVHNLQNYIITHIEKFTGLMLKEVNITVGTIS
ncbi:MAG: Asp23/Gls24 family envelope stress response protein [Spirochaetales bacterium]|nr:Asp23/Gls24 family envelope stress response protein [Spirochaetales bacterium]